MAHHPWLRQQASEAEHGDAAEPGLGMCRALPVGVRGTVVGMFLHGKCQPDADVRQVAGRCGSQPPCQGASSSKSNSAALLGCRSGSGWPTERLGGALLAAGIAAADPDASARCKSDLHQRLH
jgi:hypothetical protein